MMATRTYVGPDVHARSIHAAAELAYLDSLAAVDGLVARKAALEERLSHLAVEGEWSRTVARLRCFRGIDTLSGFALCLEIGDFARFQRPAQLGYARQRAGLTTNHAPYR